MQSANLCHLDGVHEHVGRPLQVLEAVIIFPNGDGEGKLATAVAAAFGLGSVAVVACVNLGLLVLLVREVKALVDMALSMSHRERSRVEGR